MVGDGQPSPHLTGLFLPGKIQDDLDESLLTSIAIGVSELYVSTITLCAYGVCVCVCLGRVVNCDLLLVSTCDGGSSRKIIFWMGFLKADFKEFISIEIVAYVVF